MNQPENTNQEATEMLADKVQEAVDILDGLNLHELFAAKGIAPFPAIVAMMFVAKVVADSYLVTTGVQSTVEQMLASADMISGDMYQHLKQLEAADAAEEMAVPA